MLESGCTVKNLALTKEKIWSLPLECYVWQVCLCLPESTGSCQIVQQHDLGVWEVGQGRWKGDWPHSYSLRVETGHARKTKSVTEGDSFGSHTISQPRDWDLQKQKQTYRYRKQIYGYQRRNVRGGEAGINQELGMNIHTLLYIR